jgi:glucosamine-phosphate N-acetyltransferase
MGSETQLFSADLISPAAQAALPKGYIACPIQRTDFKEGHLDVIRDLAYVGDITEEMWIERYDLMSNCKGTYYIVVIVDQNREGGKIVGTGTLVVERKLYVDLGMSKVQTWRLIILSSLYKLGTQGHLEDIAIKSDQQGKKLGLRLIEALDYVAEKVGCYKVCLLSIVIRSMVLIELFRAFLIHLKRRKGSTRSVDMRKRVRRCTTPLIRKLRNEKFESPITLLE